MLFPYKYVPNPMEKMQEFIEFIFHDVWCQAPGVQYGIHLFATNNELYAIMDELYRLDEAEKLTTGAAKYFYEHVNEIFNEFKKLTGDEIECYKNQFAANNMIEELCNGDLKVVPVTYSFLDPYKKVLNEKLRSFFKNLFSSGFLQLKVTRNALKSTLSEYYVSFVKKNREGVCPFCGLMPLDGEYDPTRDAFDHYLPKSEYPFNSVNPKNLAPSCSKCNSGNKRDQDPLHNENGIRTKAFYPFSVNQYSIEVSVEIEKGHWQNLTSDSMKISLTSKSHPEEVETWKRLFKVEKRYVATCCNKNGGIGWLNRVFSEHENYKLTCRQMLEAELVASSHDMWSERNFLKKAFLEGCDRNNLFEDG